ncbi:acetylglutamate kinase [Niabella ginsenosidivorans]|uniref:Acetylglutamate kinase n=1 Tax=Niabella ginsenosidivorans TaxID=1176587 RepID=A0A1A9IAK6_9BACT|nr:acetylglutamate kinase [Niabella ginsenosidivorans]ANH83594.1 acetylglutamate kinase [Niabella ginsenosidivorans]
MSIEQKKYHSDDEQAISQPLFIIKIGGNIIDNPVALDAFLKDFSAIKAAKILIHGGGKIATKTGERLGIVSKYIDGRRITDDATIDLVTMVYGGLVNKKLIAQLQALGTNAIGLTGADANIIPAEKRPVKAIDYGWVGDIDPSKLNSQPLVSFIEQGIIPVFAPLTHDGKGHILNTNADTIAASLAVALSKHFRVRLIYCFEKKGVLEDVNRDDSVIRKLDKELYTKLKDEKKLFEGILPKIDNAFDAIRSGVQEVLIGDAKDLIKNTTNNNEGTLIY